MHKYLIKSSFGKLKHIIFIYGQKSNEPLCVSLYAVLIADTTSFAFKAVRQPFGAGTNA